jgi:hypothetical protein
MFGHETFKVGLVPSWPFVLLPNPQASLRSKPPCPYGS